MRRFASVVAGATFALLCLSAPAGAATNCDKYAAPTGSDSAPGTIAAPLRSVQKLSDSLTAGQTGCLRAGTYTANVSISRSNITLTSYAGEAATVVGRFWIREGANRVTVSALKLDGVNSSLPTPTVNGDDALFTEDEITSGNKQICFNIGSDDGWGRAERTIIRNSRIHDCGTAGTNQIHGIYVVAADDTQILNNYIYNNADRGVQLYPNAQRTIVRGNVIDGNGEGIIFSGDDGKASNSNVVENNVISNSRLRSNVESWYPKGNPAGTNNVVRNNCVWNGATYNVDTSEGGFTATSNLTADPQFVDRAHGDFRLSPQSPCAAILAGASAPATTPAPSTGTPAPAPTPTTPTTPTAPTAPGTGGHTGTGTTTPSTGTTPPASGTTPSGSTTPSSGTTKPAKGKTRRVCKTVKVNGRRTTKCYNVAVAAKAGAKTSAAKKAAAKKAAAKKAAAKRAAARKRAAAKAAARR